MSQPLGATVHNGNLDAAVYIGRFQPFHNGHLALVRQALALAPRLIVVLGSANAPCSAKNPFTWQERAELICSALDPDARSRTEFLPIVDVGNEPLWVAHVRQGVEALVGQSAAHHPAHIGLIGHFKDESSYYLRQFAPWELISVPRHTGIDASHIRQAWLTSTVQDMPHTLSRFRDDAPASTLDFLLAWSRTPAFAQLQSETC